MNLVTNAALMSLGLVFSTPSSLLAQATPSEKRISVCSLLPKEADRYAEVYVKVGERLLTLQADADDGIESVKPKVLELANALVAKLR